MSPRPYEFPKDPSPQVEVIRKYYASLCTFDLDNLRTLTTDDSIHKVAPSSLGVPEMTKNVFLAYLGQLQAELGQHLDYTIYDINDGVGKTWVHAKLETRNIEVVYLFQFGTGHNALKIASTLGFTDSKRYLELHPE